MVHQPVGFSKVDLLAAIRYECTTFLAFYVGDELTTEIPQVHEDIWSQLLVMVEACNTPGTVKSLRKLFAVPRGHAKSTLAKLAVILFIKFTPFKFVLYASKIQSNAKNAIRDILLWLQGVNETELYGPMKTDKSSETEALWIVQIALRTHPSQPPVYKRVIFKAIGADTAVRGLLILNQRPQIIIVDDIEDIDNTKGEVNQGNLDTWFLGTLMKSFSDRHLILFLGNMIRKTSLLTRLSRNPAWNPTVYGCLVRNKETGALESLWASRWSVTELLEEYKEYRRLGKGHIWEAEMMNLTHDEILAADMEGMILVPYKSPEFIEAGFLVLDPAFGETALNDDSSITVHIRLKGTTIPILWDSWTGKANEDRLFDKMLEFSYQYGLSTWLIESIAAQKVLISYFNLMFRTRKMNPEVFMLLPIMSGGKAKSARILAFRSAITSGSYAVSELESSNVLKIADYDPQSPPPNDDYEDSAAYGAIGWEHYGTAVMYRGVSQVFALAFGTREQEYSDDPTPADITTF